MRRRILIVVTRDPDVVFIHVVVEVNGTGWVVRRVVFHWRWH